MNSILLIVYDREYRSFLRRIVEPNDPDFTAVAMCHNCDLETESRISILSFVKRIHDRSVGTKAMINPFYAVEEYRVIRLAI